MDTLWVLEIFSFTTKSANPPFDISRYNQLFLLFIRWLKEEQKVWKAQQILDLLSVENWLHYEGNVNCYLCLDCIFIRYDDNVCVC